MGYYTDFHMDIRNKLGEFITKESPEYDKISVAFNKIFLGRDYDADSDNDYLEDVLDVANWKWYECDKDMTELSKQFPEYTFVLEGDGEEKQDWWIHWWENGYQSGSEAEIIAPQGPEWYSSQF